MTAGESLPPPLPGLNPSQRLRMVYICMLQEHICRFREEERSQQREAKFESICKTRLKREASTRSGNHMEEEHEEVDYGSQRWGFSRRGWRGCTELAETSLNMDHTASRIRNTEIQMNMASSYPIPSSSCFCFTIITLAGSAGSSCSGKWQEQLHSGSCHMR